MKRRDWTDHELAAWLRAKNAISNYIVLPPMGSTGVNEYHNIGGDLICIVICDNSTSSRMIYAID